MKRYAMLAVLVCLMSSTVALAAETAVERLLVCSSVQDREPVGVAESFPAGTVEVVAFAHLVNVDCDCTISFVWSRNGKEVRTIIVPVSKEERWRSWARKKVDGQPGEWSVEVRNAANKPLMSTMFIVH
jgi:hypothetical protein